MLGTPYSHTTPREDVFHPTANSQPMESGESYKLKLKVWCGEFPGYVWWWDWGKRKDIPRARAGGEGPMMVEVIQSAFSETQLLVTMGDRPVLTVVE